MVRSKSGFRYFDLGAARGTFFVATGHKKSEFLFFLGRNEPCVLGNGTHLPLSPSVLASCFLLVFAILQEVSCQRFLDCKKKGETACENMYLQ